jgi:hypothetical protein
MSQKRTRTQPSHAMEPTASRRSERLKDEVKAELAKVYAPQRTGSG